MHREKLKKKIDYIYIEIINRTKEFEASYLKSLNDKLLAPLNSFETPSIDEELKNLEESFRNPNLIIESIDQCYSNNKRQSK